MNEKQQQLLFDKGISERPFSAISDDNCLEVYNNMAYINGEHRAVQEPKRVLKFERTGKSNLLYVHQNSGHQGKDRYIYWDYYDEKVWWTYENGGDGYRKLILEGIYNEPQITAVGNFLVISWTEGISNMLWQPEEENYFDLTGLPYPDVSFTIVNKEAYTKFFPHPWDEQMFRQVQPKFIRFYRTNFDDQSESSKFNAKVADYLKAENQCFDKKGFPHPFWIRYALKLYTGDYVFPSQPILVIPATHHAEYFGNIGVDTQGDREPKVNSYTKYFYMQYGLMYYKNNISYSGYEKVVSAITVFASEFVRPDDITVKLEEEEDPNSFELNFGTQNPNDDSPRYFEEGSIPWKGFFARKSLTRLQEELINASVFYKLCDLPLNVYGTFQSLPIESVVLRNLKTQSTLPHDDYFSRCSMVAQSANTYNQRLNIANVQRGFFNGYKRFALADNEQGGEQDGSKYVRLFIYIRSNDGDRIVCNEVNGYNTFENLHYFYYPDPRAYKVEVEISSRGGWEHWRTFQLKERPGLNGAYFLDLVAMANECENASNADYETEQTNSPTTNTTPENLGNTLLQSEVNSPMTFFAEGHITVGTGSIVGFASQTTALSEGQFGQFPMIVFTTEGTWALTVDNTGLYTSSTPMSRDVCNNALSITQTDGAIFFASDRGLMLNVGREVKCVSEQMGYDFIRDLKALDVKIAYDYRDSLLWIYSKRMKKFWLYNTKTQTFSTTDRLDSIWSVANNYPDTLIQKGKEVFSLLQRPLPDQDDKLCYGEMVTRPMKLENAFALKTILQVKNLFHSSVGYLTVGLRIFASNNLDNWVELSSLRGRPWKYYKFQFDFEDLAPTDTFAGTVLVTQERRTNKLR